MNFTELIGKAIDIINPLLVIMVALAMLVFFKGLVQFIAKSGDAKNHADGRNLMVWGLIGIFVMVSVIGILNFAYNDLGFNRQRNFSLPTLPQNP